MRECPKASPHCSSQVPVVDTPPPFTKFWWFWPKAKNLVADLQN